MFVFNEYYWNNFIKWELNGCKMGVKHEQKIKDIT